MHASINMHQLINPDNDNSFITFIAISVVIAVKCAYNTAAYISHFYEACESTRYTLQMRLTDRSKTLYSYCVKDFSLI